MKVLVIGGTKLLGKEVVINLIKNKDEVTVISRNSSNLIEGANYIIKEKQDGVKSLSGMEFDCVIDFIAYDSNSYQVVFDNIKFKKYIVISSTWVAKLNKNSKLNQKIENIDPILLETFNDTNKRYLTGKISLEHALEKFENTCVIRCPILWDKNEYTKRLDFYIERILDEKPFILVNGGKNIVQLAYVKDLAKAISKFIRIKTDDFYYEALCENPLTLKDTILTISSGLNKEVKIVSFDESILKNELNEYLAKEPLWREYLMDVTPNNIYKVCDVEYLKMKDWLKIVAEPKVFEHNELREKELELVKKYYE